MLLEQELKFTKVCRDNWGLPIPLREARALRALYPALLPPLEEEDLFAGRTLKMEWSGVGFSPDVTLYSLPHGMGFFYRRDVFEQALSQASENQKPAIRDAMAFWEKENTTAHVKAAFSDRIRKALPSDSFAGDVGVGFPLYRMTGAYENYELLLSLGLDGLLARIDAAEKKNPQAEEGFYAALKDVVQLISECCLVYADHARAMGKTRMADDLAFVSHAAPVTFTQAIQLMWLYSCLAGVMDYGRLDVILSPFLKRDSLSDEEAVSYLCGLFRLMVARKTVYHGRVIIGGRGRPDEKGADRVAMLCMEAARIVHDIEPQLSLRFYESQNPALLNKAYEVLATGATYPMLYNDDVNIPDVQEAFRYPEEMAEQYVPFGCGEYIIDHRTFGSPNGVINLLKALEVTLTNGRDLVYGREMGLKLGGLLAFDTFDDLYAAYKRQLAYYIEVLAETEKLILTETSRQAPFLMMSLLYDGCIERGKSMLSGGIDGLAATLESYGNINTVDSLAAIRACVYEEKTVTKEQLLEAISHDFEGYEDVRAKLLAAPKFGNDDDRVDDIARDLHAYEADWIRAQADRVGLASFLMVIINNSANTYLGRFTGASPDGRKARTFMANAVNPVGGMDRSGPTAMLNSLLKIPSEHHAGTVQNMKFSRGMIERSPEKFRALLDTYFAGGGTQSMITVVGRKDLENALAHPDEYRNLLVRVGGFSARFVELESDVQQEILSRTLY